MVVAMNGAACYHCGESVSAHALIRADLDGAERAFCCTGCRAAAEWLHQGGLADYYTLRSEVTGRVDAAQDFGDWDSAGFRRLYVHDIDGQSECDLSIGNIRCAACAWLIDRVGRQMPGVAAITVDPATTHARVRFDPARTSLSAIAARLAAIGYAPRIVQDPADAKRERRQSLKRLAVAGLGAMQAMMFTEALYWGADELDVGTRDFFRIVAMLVATPVVFYSGFPFFRGAWRELSLRQPGMDVLVSLSVGLAYVASVIETLRGGPAVYFDAAVMFVFLLGAARHVEAIARARATERLQLIASTQHQHADRIDASGHASAVALSELRHGDRIRVASGESVPVDGRLQSSAARVDESLLTGEAEPVPRAIGDTVLAGSVALDTPLLLEVTAVGTATRLGQLRARIGTGLHLAAGSTELGQRIAARFTLAMLVVAALTGLYWANVDAARAMPAVLAVLAAACPCAFALALPASLAAAHSMLAKHGVIVTRPDALTRATRIDRIVCDKTGTLTEGRPRLIEAFSLDAAVPRARALAIAAALERGHRHPLAHAFREFDCGVEVEAAQALAGSGVLGQVDGQTWRLGRADWSAASDGDDIVLANAGGVVARFRVADRLRAEAVDAVRDWQRFATVEVMSGDHPDAVATVAGVLGIDARGRLTPEQKRAAIQALRAQGHRVLMIGDGLNDTESLAAADVGVAMGGGAAIAQCHADVLLLRDDLRLVRLLIDTAQHARRIARQNLGWSIGYHLMIVPFAVTGLMSPWLAAVGMAASSLLVTLNALRLRRAPVMRVPDARKQATEVHA
ncbi:MAG TPA: heavy metal translocating P-type ATPase [Patescibacteria group bacterium]|nr:heavy metal translocating P-type ATPase [Patescibacteria group bacterium]